MKDMLYLIVEYIARIHDKINTLNDHTKGFTDKELHLIVIGVIGMTKVFVLVPLWAIGWAIWTVAGGLWTMLLGPIAGKAVSWLFLLAALLGAAALGLKTVFPDLPLKKIFNKKSLLGLILGGLGLGVADLTVPMFWDGYEALAHVLRASGMALILGTVAFALVRRILREKQAEPAPEEAPEEPENRPWTREEILALADSVSRKR